MPYKRSVDTEDDAAEVASQLIDNQIGFEYVPDRADAHVFQVDEEDSKSLDEIVDEAIG